MIVAVTSMGDSLDDQVAYRLSRSPYYLIINTEDMSVEPIENMDRVLDREISDECVQLMIDRGVECLVTGHCGPTAFGIFKSAGISIVPGVSGAVVEAVEFVRNEDTHAVDAESSAQAKSESPQKKKVARGKTLEVNLEEYLSMKAEMVVMQRKLLELHRRVDKLEKQQG